MRSYLRPAAAVVAAVSMAVGLAACGKAADGAEGGIPAGGFSVGLLLPENQTARYETFDRPLIEKKIKELCRDCTVEYANAHGGVATQHQQVDAMISKGVEVLILGTVDSKSLRSAVVEAVDAGIPVVSYDRLVEGPISAFITYDSESVGRIQGEALLKALGGKADGDRIIWLEGPKVTHGATSRENGARSVLEGEVKISKSYEAAGWNAENAYAITSGAIATLGADNIDGVYVANDVLAAGVSSALEHAHIEPLPPVTGQDAELPAVQRIVSGEQLMSVYKPYKPEADTAAEMAVALARGEKIDNMAEDRVSTPTTKDVPSVLLTPIPVTAENIKDTVIKDGVYTVEQICTTPGLQSACEKKGLTE